MLPEKYMTPSLFCRFLHGRSDEWLENLRKQLQDVPHAGLGEVHTPLKCLFLPADTVCQLMLIS